MVVLSKKEANKYWAEERRVGVRGGRWCGYRLTSVHATTISNKVYQELERISVALWCSVRKRPVRSGLGLGRRAWAFFAAGQAGLWATVRFSGPIWPGLAGLQISAGFRVIRCDWDKIRRWNAKSYGRKRVDQRAAEEETFFPFTFALMIVLMAN